MDANEIHEFIEESWEAYKSVPVNFGKDDYATQLAEHDAFYAGALAAISLKLPF